MILSLFLALLCSYNVFSGDDCANCGVNKARITLSLKGTNTGSMKQMVWKASEKVTSIDEFDQEEICDRVYQNDVDGLKKSLIGLGIKDLRKVYSEISCNQNGGSYSILYVAFSGAGSALGMKNFLLGSLQNINPTIFNDKERSGSERTSEFVNSKIKRLKKSPTSQKRYREYLKRIKKLGRNVTV